MRVRTLIFLAALAFGLVGCKAHPAAAAGAVVARDQLVPIDSTVLNLADTGNPSYLRLGISVAVSPSTPLNPQTTALVTSVATDAVVEVVSARTAASLLTPQGKDDLKATLLAQIQHRLPGIAVQGIYFNEFLVQQ